jgi:hypothetical protein
MPPVRGTKGSGGKEAAGLFGRGSLVTCDFSISKA